MKSLACGMIPEGAKKQPPPYDHHRALGMVLLQGPRGRRFLMTEVPLQGGRDLRQGRCVLRQTARVYTRFFERKLPHNLNISVIVKRLCSKIYVSKCVVN